jgi:hypothetical protein
MPESFESQVLDGLDAMLAVLQLAHADAIASARHSVREDPVNVAVLEAAEDWIATGALQDRVGKAAAVSSRTVRDRIAQLLARRGLVSRGAGRALEFKATGLL